jgi:hypothetical protein
MTAPLDLPRPPYHPQTPQRAPTSTVEPGWLLDSISGHVHPVYTVASILLLTNVAVFVAIAPGVRSMRTMARLPTGPALTQVGSVSILPMKDARCSRV